MLLILDASNKAPFLALISSSEILDFEHLDGSIPLSRTLYPALDILLSRNNLRSDHLKKVVFGRGPGSFLGTRTAANLSSALHCALGVEVCSYISPLAYLPFEEGRFAYFMRPKGGKYPILLGVKNGFESKIHSTHLLSNFDEVYELQEIIDAKIKYVVIDPALKKEIDAHRMGNDPSFTIREYQVDKSFLKVLAESASIKENLEATETLASSNPFGLLY